MHASNIASPGRMTSVQVRPVPPGGGGAEMHALQSAPPPPPPPPPPAPSAAGVSLGVVPVVRDSVVQAARPAPQPPVRETVAHGGEADRLDLSNALISSSHQQHQQHQQHLTSSHLASILAAARGCGRDAGAAAAATVSSTLLATVRQGAAAAALASAAVAFHSSLKLQESARGLGPSTSAHSAAVTTDGGQEALSSVASSTHYLIGQGAQGAGKDGELLKARAPSFPSALSSSVSAGGLEGAQGFGGGMLANFAQLNAMGVVATPAQGILPLTVVWDCLEVVLSEESWVHVCVECMRRLHVEH
jgi:hypothetical protein